MRPPQRNTPTSREEDRLEVLDIGAVLLFYGADNIPSGSGWRKMKCIHGERNPSACVNTEEGAFTCFSCGLKGDTISIIRKQENDCSFSQACDKYKEITGTEVPNQRTSRFYGEASTAESKSYEADGWLASRLRKG